MANPERLKKDLRKRSVSPAKIDYDYDKYRLRIKEDLITRLTEKHGLSLGQAWQVTEDLVNLERLPSSWPIARLCDDYSEPETFKAIDLLSSVGFSVSATACTGLGGPTLNLGNREYFGCQRIEKLVDDILSRFIKGVPAEELLRGFY